MQRVRLMNKFLLVHLLHPSWDPVTISEYLDMLLMSSVLVPRALI